MSAEIDSAILAKLTADQSDGTLYSELSGRIHAKQLPNDREYPAMRFAVIADPMVMRLQSDARTIDVQFDIYGARNAMSTLEAINVLLRGLLHRATLTITGFSGGQTRALDWGIPVKEPDVSRITTRYRIFANE